VVKREPHIKEVPGSNSGRDSAMPSGGLHGFPQSPLAESFKVGHGQFLTYLSIFIVHSHPVSYATAKSYRLLIT